LKSIAVDGTGLVEVVKVAARDTTADPCAVLLCDFVAALPAVIAQVFPLALAVEAAEHLVNNWKDCGSHDERITIIGEGESPSWPPLCYFSARMKYFRPGDERRIDKMDVNAIGRMMPAVGLLERYFRYRVSNLERIPSEGPALIAMNHGALPVDVPLLGRKIFKATGRLPRSLTDNLIFKAPGLREVALAIGAVAGHPETARELLDQGNLVIVMPGGAPEAFKSSSKAYQLYWRKRLGFARLAIRAQVPVIPAACIGIDELFDIPWDMFEAGKKIFGVRSLPFGIAWGAGLGIPRRVPLAQYIGHPIHPDVPSEAADDEVEVARFRDRVVESMEELMDAGLRQRAEDEIAERKAGKSD